MWLGNSRGNSYSRSHISLNASSDEFWSFSFDQMAQFDMPAQLQYVLTTTGSKQLSFIAHSQGTTVLLAALSFRPELTRSLASVVLLAPVAFSRHIQSLPFLSLSALGTDKVTTDP